MKVLLTGASSFTGFWFAKVMREKGHDIVAPLRGGQGSYSGTRAKRVTLLESLGVKVLYGVSFGSGPFLEIIREGFDIICHHAAIVNNYKSMDFDVLLALKQNTYDIRSVFEVARKVGVRTIVHTGSVFEQGEGCGERPLKAFSPYGLSKGLTHQVLEYWAGEFGVTLLKFVISNPFGPYEEARFCNYLLSCWTKGEIAVLKTPEYIRDNIHVSLLALAYNDFVENRSGSLFSEKYGPSGYIESQGEFARRFAREIGQRLKIETPLQFLEQKEFLEPKVRINVDRLKGYNLGWNEEEAWDFLAEYYRKTILF